MSNFIELLNAATRTVHECIKPDDLLINKIHTVVGWRFVLTKFGEQLQFEIKDNGFLWMPQRIYKLFSKEIIAEPPPADLKLKFIGRDKHAMKAPLYEIWQGDDEDEEEFTMSQFAQKY